MVVNFFSFVSVCDTQCFVFVCTWNTSDVKIKESKQRRFVYGNMCQWLLREACKMSFLATLNKLLWLIFAESLQVKNLHFGDKNLHKWSQYLVIHLISVVVRDVRIFMLIVQIFHNSLYVLLLVGCRVVTSDKSMRKSFTQPPRRFAGQRPHNVFTPRGTKWPQWSYQVSTSTLYTTDWVVTDGIRVHDTL